VQPDSVRYAKGARSPAAQQHAAGGPALLPAARQQSGTSPQRHGPAHAAGRGQASRVWCGLPGVRARPQSRHSGGCGLQFRDGLSGQSGEHVVARGVRQQRLRVPHPGSLGQPETCCNPRRRTRGQSLRPEYLHQPPLAARPAVRTAPHSLQPLSGKAAQQPPRWLFSPTLCALARARARARRIAGGPSQPPRAAAQRPGSTGRLAGVAAAGPCTRARSARARAGTSAAATSAASSGRLARSARRRMPSTRPRWNAILCIVNGCGARRGAAATGCGGGGAAAAATSGAGGADAAPPRGSTSGSGDSAGAAPAARGPGVASGRSAPAARARAQLQARAHGSQPEHALERFWCRLCVLARMVSADALARPPRSTRSAAAAPSGARLLAPRRARAPHPAWRWRPRAPHPA